MFAAGPGTRHRWRLVPRRERKPGPARRAAGRYAAFIWGGGGKHGFVRVSVRHLSQTSMRTVPARLPRCDPPDMLHVVPDERGHWRIFEEVGQAPLSQHDSATEAELWAWSHASRAEEIVVHDRYGRLRPVVRYDLEDVEIV